jgi:hypothetical protein
VTIEFLCPVCGAPLQFADELKGAARPCPHCQASLLVWPAQAPAAPHDAGFARALVPDEHLVIPKHVAYRAPRTRPRWWVYPLAIMSAACLAALLALAFWWPSPQLPPELTQRMNLEAARVAQLQPAEAMAYLLDGGVLPPGVVVEVAALLDQRTVVFEAAAPWPDRSPGRLAVYGLLLSRQDPAADHYERFRVNARALQHQLQSEQGPSPASLAEQWELLRQSQAKTIGSRAIIVRLDPIRYPTLQRQASQASRGRIVGRIDPQGDYEPLPPADSGLLWPGSRHLDRCREDLARVVAGPQALQPVQMKIEQIGFRPQVAAAFAAGGTGQALQFVGMFVQR